MQFALTRRLYIIFYFHSYRDDSFSEWDFSRLVLFHQQALSLFYFFVEFSFKEQWMSFHLSPFFSILLSTDAGKGKTELLLNCYAICQVPFTNCE